MNLAIPKQIIRRFGAIRVLDNIRYRFMQNRNRIDNKKFKVEHPNIQLPPEYLLYESHNINYRFYIEKGKKNAIELLQLFQNYIDLEQKVILDWGCGPSRIVRHLPELLPNAKIFGTDYNKATIDWNKNHINEVTFYDNDVNPPTQFENNFFDAIYGLSIFTHLSEDNHYNWIKELYRISKTDAVIIITTHGVNYKSKLTKADQKKFEANKLVVKGNTLEGHRTYAAYHPVEFMRQLFEGKFEVLQHIPWPIDMDHMDQDKWVIKKI